MSLALIQGSSGSLGQAFIQHLLRKTNLDIIATSRNPSKLKSSILSSVQEGDRDRLHVFEMDLKKEDSIERVSNEVEKKWGKGELRLLINTSGVLHADKSIMQVHQEELLHQYQINTFGHLLTYKHFMPLLPKKIDVKKALEKGGEDKANGMISPGLSVLASLTARVGSIGDNKKGGWVGYRSSKAATNQIIVTLQRELQMRSTPSIAIALHPGTVVGTDLSKDFTKSEDAGKKEGVFEAKESTERLLDVIKGLKEGDGGRFLDWAGKDIQW